MNNQVLSERVQKAGAVFLMLATAFLAVKIVGSVKSWSDHGIATDAKPKIVVTGSGDAFSVPDTATFTFSVVEHAKTVQDAQKLATDRTNKALAFLKGAGIPEKDIKTVGYNIYPQYDYQQVTCVRYPCPSGKQVLTGYEVSQSIEVRTKDTTKAGELLSGIGSLGVQNVSGLTFTVDNDDAVMREARQKAITDAKTKAEALAKDLGVSLVRIVDFQESSNNPVYYSRAMMAQGKAEALDSVAPAPQVPSGENKVTSNVTITYEIR